MRAVQIRDFGPAACLELVDVKPPQPSATEVLVRVKALGINRADILQRLGKYPAPAGSPANIPGLEYAGEIRQIGQQVNGWSTGDRVMGIVGGGAYAEYLVVAASTLIAIPDVLDDVHAAGVPEAFITAHDALITQAKLCQEEAVLIHAAASGVGKAAVQLAHQLGTRVVGSTRSANKLDGITGLGADHAILVREAQFANQVAELVGPINVVLDLVGAKYISENFRCLDIKGRLIQVGLVAGSQTEINLATLLSKRLTLRGTVLRSRSMSEKVEVIRAFQRDVLPMICDGRLRPHIDKVFVFEQCVQAHEYVESNTSAGKVVLRLD